MIRFARRLATGLGLLLLASASAQAAYNVEVNAVPDLSERVKVVAIVPMACPATVDCLWIENRLHQDLIRFTSLRVMPASRIRKRLFETEIQTITEENRAAIGERLGVDSFLIPLIHDSGTTSAGAVGIPAGAIVIAAPVEMARIQAELLLIAAEDAKKLLQGTGFGESFGGAAKNVAAKLFRQIIKKGLPKRS